MRSEMTKTCLRFSSIATIAAGAFALNLMAAEKPGAFNTLTAQEKAAGWKLLFDGKTTQGWRSYRKETFPEKGWVVEDGCLKKVAKVRGGDIITEAKFDDFELRWEWRVALGGNNGLKYLVSEERPGAPGHEYQMVDDQRHPDAAKGAKRVTASFYAVVPVPEDRPSKPAGEWNESRVTLKGNHVEHWLNGTKVLEYELGSDALKAAIAESKFKDAAGFGTKLRGHIMLTDHGDECWFRNIRIRDLSAK